MTRVRILGGGPAGTAAALAALGESAQVEIVEKSKFPRHKVCGEFLTPEVVSVLAKLGVWDEFLDAQPAKIHRLDLHFGDNRPLSCRLPAPAYGLSRYQLDKLLLDRAMKSGAMLKNESFSKPQLETTDGVATVLSAGRQASALSSTGRLFGFKAHFTGPTDDAVNLYFFEGCYVGVSAVEGGITNICGLGPEGVLRGNRFDFDAVLARCRPLADRIGGLTRTMDWLSVAPLCFGIHWREFAGGGVYPAGDALAFIDPFAGSGMTNAILMGQRAGIAAARGIPVDRYLSDCRRVLARPFLMASLFRTAIRVGLAEALAPMLPARLLFRATRPAAW